VTRALAQILSSAKLNLSVFLHSRSPIKPSLPADMPSAKRHTRRGTPFRPESRALSTRTTESTSCVSDHGSNYKGGPSTISRNMIGLKFEEQTACNHKHDYLLVSRSAVRKLATARRSQSRPRPRWQPGGGGQAKGDRRRRCRDLEHHPLEETFDGDVGSCWKDRNQVGEARKTVLDRGRLLAPQASQQTLRHVLLTREATHLEGTAPVTFLKNCPNSPQANAQNCLPRNRSGCRSQLFRLNLASNPSLQRSEDGDVERLQPSRRQGGHEVDVNTSIGASIKN
jgi:hypothetical protein